MRSRLRKATFSAAFFAFAMSSVAEARAPAEIEQDANQLLVLVQGMDASELAAGFRGRGDTSFASQMADGEVFYVLGQYEDASLVLAELVEHPDAFNEVGYPRALFLLGDSLYRQENYGLAESYYRRLFELNDDEYSLDAGLRIVEIELKKRDYEAAIEQLDIVEERYGDVAGDAIVYVRGKVKYESGDIETAISVYEAIQLDSEFYPRAQYLAGVAEAKLEEYDRALERYGFLVEDLQARDTLSEIDANVLQLTHLAQGRIHYEFSRWDKASYHYSLVEAESDQFDAALYEMSWTMIQQERFQNAAYNLEVLAEISDDTRFIAEARLLAGNMKRRATQYQEAETLYDSTGDDYGSIYTQMSDIIDSNDNVALMYGALPRVRTGGVDAELDVSHWVTEDPLVARSLAYVKNAAEIESWLTEGEEVVRLLRRTLSEEDIYNIFPAASRFRGTMSTYWRQSVVLRVEAVDEQYDEVNTSLTEAQTRDYRRLRDERNALLERFLNMDFRVAIEEGSELGASPTQAMDAMIGDLAATESQLERDLAEITELQSLLRQGIGRGDIGPEEALELENELADTREELAEQLDRVRDRRRALLDERSDFSGDEAERDVTDESMRVLRELIAALNAESLVLEQASGRVDDDNYDEIYSTLDTVDSQLNALRGGLGRALARRREVYQRMLNLESRRISGMRQVLDSYGDEGSEVTREVALESLLLAHERIGDVVLRANLGSIDVSWWQKESISRQIEELFDEKSRQLQVLDADFAEILGEQ